jgi:hypothetical protein
MDSARAHRDCSISICRLSKYLPRKCAYMLAFLPIPNPVSWGGIDHGFALAPDWLLARCGLLGSGSAASLGLSATALAIGWGESPGISLRRFAA